MQYMNKQYEYHNAFPSLICVPEPFFQEKALLFIIFVYCPHMLPSFIIFVYYLRLLSSFITFVYYLRLLSSFIITTPCWQTAACYIEKNAVVAMRRLYLLNYFALLGCPYEST